MTPVLLVVLETSILLVIGRFKASRLFFYAELIGVAGFLVLKGDFFWTTL
jgi:hypothetical protein